MKKDYITEIANAERRFLSNLPELRKAEDNSRSFGGLGIVYNRLSENFIESRDGGLYEIIEPGAADGLLNDEEIMILFNHDPSLVLGRNGVTAKLTETAEGIEYSGDAPNTTTGNDLIENLRLKNVRKSSFAFIVADHREERTKWQELGMINLRRIVKFKRLFDFSPVTYPAYPDTTVAQRSFNSSVNDYLIDHVKRRNEIFKLTNQ